MARVLFMLHGMGEFADGWESDVVDLLNRLAAAQRAVIGIPLRFGAESGADVRTVPIRYDDIFTDYWAREARAADHLTAFAAANEVQLPRPDLWTWLAQGDDDRQTFLRASILDVVLFRFFARLRQRVRERIALRIAEALERLPGGLSGNSIVFLAHSLGTAVLQQSLEHLGTTPLPGGIETYLYRGAPLYDAAVLCANVSRVLEQDDVHSRSIVAPSTRAGHPGCLGAYYSFRHALDPFLWFRPFDPGDWGDGLVSPPQLRHYLEPNVHGYLHYLQHPAVHLNLFNAVAGDLLANEQVIADRTREYEGAHGLDAYLVKLAAERGRLPEPCLHQLEGFPAFLQSLAQSRDDVATVDDWLALGVQYGGGVARVARVCGGRPGAVA